VGTDVVLEGAILLQLGPPIARGFIYLVEFGPFEHEEPAFAVAIDGACKVVEDELAALLGEYAVRVPPTHVIAGRLGGRGTCHECSPRSGQELGRADQIASRQRQGEGAIYMQFSSQLPLGQTGRTLDLAEYLLDALAAALADLIASMVRRALVDGRGAWLAILVHRPTDGDVRHDAPGPQITYKLQYV